MLGLVVLLEKKAVQVHNPRAKVIHKALQQVLGKQDVGF
jgi:hypothetical protein